jgi:hypothetical protein
MKTNMLNVVELNVFMLAVMAPNQPIGQGGHSQSFLQKWRPIKKAIMSF